MSARKTLDDYIETLQILAREGDTDRTDAERERDAAHRAKLIDAFAHELAEQQRAYAREVGVPLEDGDTVSAGDVIDLIDPQVGSAEPTLRLVESGRCTATLQGWPIEVVDECVHEAGHYDPADPDSWHQAEPDAAGNRTKWSDSANGATPHCATPDEEPAP
jgi:hypothetical protein